MKHKGEYNRRSIRLPEYDYSQSGYYFVTICTYQKQCLFGEIKHNKIILNQIGNMVTKEWLKSSNIRKEIQLDQWILMPNHIHGIVIIRKNMGASLAPLQKNRLRKPRSLSTFISGFKSAVTKYIKTISIGDDIRVWQKNYYESIIRNEEQLNNIRQYIIDNPYKWDINGTMILKIQLNLK